MSLFFDLLCAVNSPNQRASASALATVAQVIDAAAQQQGISPLDLEGALSAIAPYLRAVLQQQMSILKQPADSVVHQLAEMDGADTMQTIIPPSVYSEMSRAVAAQTALSEPQADGALSMLVPVAMHLLDLGAQYNVENGNLLVSRFLNSDRPEDGDLGTVAHFIRRMAAPTAG